MFIKHHMCVLQRKLTVPDKTMTLCNWQLGKGSSTVHIVCFSNTIASTEGGTASLSDHPQQNPTRFLTCLDLYIVTVSAKDAMDFGLFLICKRNVHSLQIIFSHCLYWWRYVPIYQDASWSTGLSAHNC